MIRHHRLSAVGWLRRFRFYGFRFGDVVTRSRPWTLSPKATPMLWHAPPADLVVDGDVQQVQCSEQLPLQLPLPMPHCLLHLTSEHPEEQVAVSIIAVLTQAVYQVVGYLVQKAMVADTMSGSC